MEIASFFFSNSYAVKSFIPRNIVSIHHHLRIYLACALLETHCRFFGDHTFRFWASIKAADWNFSAPGAHKLVGFPYYAGNIIRRLTPMI